MVFSKGVFMSATKLIISKITAVILIVFSLIMLVFFGAYLISPESITQFFENMPAWMNAALDILSMDNAVDATLTLGSFFERFDIPSYSFGLAGAAPVISVNLVVIILFIALTIVSYIVPPISLITTLGANLVGCITAIRMIGAFNAERAQGGSTWALASSCFWPLLLMFVVLLFSGCDQWVDVFAGLDERRRVSEYLLYSSIFAVIAFVVSFVLSALAWLIMGIGWAGFVFVAVALITVADIILESILLFRSVY